MTIWPTWSKTKTQTTAASDLAGRCPAALYFVHSEYVKSHELRPCWTISKRELFDHRAQQCNGSACALHANTELTTTCRVCETRGIETSQQWRAYSTIKYYYCSATLILPVVVLQLHSMTLRRRTVLLYHSVLSCPVSTVLVRVYEPINTNILVIVQPQKVYDTQQPNNIQES